MASCDDILVLDMRLARAAGAEDARLALLRDDETNPRPIEHDWLHLSELQAAAAMGSETARRAFLQGRVAAKRAICALRQDPSPQQICIGMGVFGQPVIVAGPAGALSVSIAHCDGLIAAVAFPQGHPLGLDAEAISSADETAMRALVSPQEIAPAFEAREGLLRAWCAKESLGKILRCGLAAPANVLALEGGSLEGPVWQGRFLAHSQYSFFTLRGGDHVFALTHPARTNVIFDLRRLLAFLA